MIECIRSQLPPGVWDQLWEGRPPTPDEQGLIYGCEASGGALGAGPGQGGALLQDLPEAVKDCIRSQLLPGAWDQLWDGRPANAGEQGLIDGCEASGGNMG